MPPTARGLQAQVSSVPAVYQRSGTLDKELIPSGSVDLFHLGLGISIVNSDLKDSLASAFIIAYKIIR